MKIVNETRFSNKLIKRLMRLAAVKKETDKTLRIVQDRRFKDRLGYFEAHDDKACYVVRLQNEGDTSTLGHELRHLAQYQRGLFETWTDNELELDAESFETWLEVNNLF